MLVVVAIPCLNEEATVEAACRSLGFGSGSVQPDIEAVLVLVDNGSSDGTLPALHRVAATSPIGSVQVIQEPDRGYVPARHRGTLEAGRIAVERGVPSSDVLLVQADADTMYMPGYLASMGRCSLVAGPGVLIEGYSEAAPVSPAFAAYRKLERLVDDAVAGALHDGEFDVVVDDKVAAFRLSDYLAWGGHRREWGQDGDEVLAETTRLYMRARMLGGRHGRAEAFAHTSDRRIIEDAGLAFATAGYPRGPLWRESWRKAYLGPSELAGFDAPLSVEAATQLVQARVTHLIGLFRLLPDWMDANARPTDNEHHSGHAACPGIILDGVLSRPWIEISELLAANATKVTHVIEASSRTPDT